MTFPFSNKNLFTIILFNLFLYPVRFKSKIFYFYISFYVLSCDLVKQLNTHRESLYHLHTFSLIRTILLKHEAQILTLKTIDPLFWTIDKIPGPVRILLVLIKEKACIFSYLIGCPISNYIDYFKVKSFTKRQFYGFACFVLFLEKKKKSETFY